MGNWISVTTKLPPNGKEVLVYASRSIYTGAYFSNEGGKGGSFWLANYGENDDINGYVKFWQPLPPKPRKNTKSRKENILVLKDNEISFDENGNYKIKGNARKKFHCAEMVVTYYNGTRIVLKSKYQKIYKNGK